jgi:hypothetical protein
VASRWRRAAVWVCVLGAATLVAGIGVASGAKLTTKSASETLSPGEFDSATAKCKRGTKAISGGFDSDTDPAAIDGSAILPYTSRAEGGRQWTSTGLNLEDTGEVTSFAYCRDQKVERRSDEATVDPGESETVTARCPRGTKAISGGFDNPDFILEDPPIVAIFPNESMKTGRREWTVSGLNLGDTPGTLVAQVNCHEGKGLKTSSEDLFIDFEGVHDVTAECAPGRRVISGGFEYSLDPEEDAFVFASHKDGKRAWEVKAYDDAAPATLTAYAYCEKKKRKK